MFDWLTGKKTRERNDALVRTMVKAMAEGDQIQNLRFAASTIDVVTTSKEDAGLVAVVASGLAKRLAAAEGFPLSDGDTTFTTGLFALIASNHFSRLTGDDFEMASSLAVVSVCTDLSEASDLLAGVIQAYNSMVDAGDKSVEAVGQNVARWTSDPCDANLARLRALFRIFRESVSDVENDGSTDDD